jgi:hypothetical protein
MSTQVGAGIDIPIRGDVSGLSASVREATEKLSELQEKHSTLRQAVKQATETLGAEHAVTKALRLEADAAAKSFGNLTGTQSAFAASSHAATTSLGRMDQASSSLRETADRLDSKLGKMQIVIGGLSQAAGASGGAIQNLVGGFADLFMGIAGGVGVIAVAGAALAVLTKYIDDADKAARALDEAWEKTGKQSLEAAEALDKQLRATNNLIEAQKIAAKTGADPASVARQLQGIDAVTDALGEVERAQKKLDAYKLGTKLAGENIVDAAGHMSPAVQARVQAQAEERAPGQLLLEKDLAAKQRNAASTEKAAEAQEKLATQTQSTTSALAAMATAFRSTQDVLDYAADLVGNGPNAVAKEAFDKSPVVLEMLGIENASKGEMAEYSKAEPFETAIGDFADALDASADELRAWADVFQEEIVLHEDMSTAQIDAINSIVGFNRNLEEGSDAIIDLRTSAERVGDAFGDVGSALLNSAVDLASAVLSGNGGASAGKIIGGVGGAALGGALAPMIGLDPGTGAQLGGGIGGALGESMGSLIDSLVESLGVLSPLFDALSTIVAALQPIFLVVGELVNGIAVAIEPLAALVLALARPIAAVLLLFVRMVEALLLIVPFILPAIVALAQVVEMLTPVFAVVDEGMRSFLNVLVQAVNTLIGINNGLVREGRKFFGDEWGVMMKPLEAFGAVIENFHQDQADLGGAIEENTDAINKNVDETLVNLPAGVKVAEYSYGAANARGGVSVGVMNVYPRTTTAQELDDMKKRGLRGTVTSLGRNTITEDKN